VSWLRRLVAKHSATGGSDLAALLTYYGFLAVFPLLLAGVTILGLVLRGHPELQDDVLTSSLVQFPVIGNDLRDNVQGLPGVSGLVSGLVFGLLGARGFCLALQKTVDVVWDVPKDQRPRWLSQQLRTFKLLAVVGGGIVMSAGLTALSSTSAVRLVLLLLVVPGTALLLLGALRFVAPDAVPTRDLVVSSAVGAVGLVALQLAGSRLVTHLTTSKAVYGTFATVLGLLGWIYLQSMVLVVALEAGALRGETAKVLSPEPTPQRQGQPSSPHTHQHGRPTAARPTGGS
jgi:uncharacterized BrkB/YihY/UPF0761 family membrane protein